MGTEVHGAIYTRFAILQERLDGNVLRTRFPATAVTHLGEIASVLVQDDPLGQAGRVLRQLVDHARASGAALLVPRNGDLQLVVGAQVGLERLAAGQRIWLANREAIGHGGHVASESDPTVAALMDGPVLAGILLLDGGRFDAQDLDSFLVVLAKALVATSEHREVGLEVDRFISKRDQEGRQRRALLQVLDESEWNVSRAARVMGVTRRTVYMQMRRFNIQRKRILKSTVA